VEELWADTASKVLRSGDRYNNQDFGTYGDDLEKKKTAGFRRITSGSKGVVWPLLLTGTGRDKGMTWKRKSEATSGLVRGISGAFGT